MTHNTKTGTFEYAKGRAQELANRDKVPYRVIRVPTPESQYEEYYYCLPSEICRLRERSLSVISCYPE